MPTYYWTAGARAHADYTAGLARGLPPDVDVFWTGPEVRAHAITADDARAAAGLFGLRGRFELRARVGDFGRRRGPSLCVGLVRGRR